MIEPNYVMKATVSRVVDGDTVVMDVSPAFRFLVQEYKFRLHGINTPELHDKDPTVRALANKAKDYVKAAIEGKNIFVQTFKTPRTSVDMIDSFGRYLAKIYYDKNGTQICLNDELVDLGLAVVFMP